MRRLAALLFLLLVGSAQAATVPPGQNTNIIYNDNGFYGAYALGNGIGTSTSGGQTFLNFTGTGSPGGTSGQLQLNNVGAFGGISIGSGLITTTSGGTTYLNTTATSGLTPGGSSGYIQYNNGSGGLGGYSIGAGLAVSGGALISTSTGGGATPGGTNNSIQINGNGSFAGLSTDTLASYAAHDTVSNGLAYDPRNNANNPGNPAICHAPDVFTSDGHTMTYNYTTPFVGTTSTDNTNFYVYTITSGVATILTTAQFSVTGVNTGVGGTITLGSAPSNGSYIVVLHDDTPGFVGTVALAAVSGGYISVPDNCWVQNMTWANGGNMIGQGFSPNYGFNPDFQKPVMHIISPPGFAPQFGINLGNPYIYQAYFAGFTIEAGQTSVPALASYEQVPVCLGTNNGMGGGVAPAIVAEHMDFRECVVGFGAPVGGSSGYMFVATRFNNYSANAYGTYGPFSDWKSLHDDAVSNSSDGIHIGPQESAVGNAAGIQITALRTEYNGNGIVLDSAGGVNIEGIQSEGNASCGMVLANGWNDISVTGGAFTYNANLYAGGTGNTTAGQDAHLCFQGTAGAGNFHMSGVDFVSGYSQGFTAPLGTVSANTPPYVLDVSTTGANNANIEIDNGEAQLVAGNNGAAVTDFAIYRNGKPPGLKINLHGQAAQGNLVNGQFAAQSPGLPPNNWQSYTAFGDPVTYGAFLTDYSPTPPSPFAYPVVLGNDMNVSPVFYVQNDFSTFSCDVVNLQIFPNYNPGNQDNPLVTWLPDVSDPSFGNGDYQGHLADTQLCATAAFSWMGIPQSSKTYAQAATTTGSWGNFSSYGGAIGLTSTTQNSALTFTVSTSAPAAYIGYELQATGTGITSGGQFSVTVDGTLAATISTAGNASWTYSCGSLCPGSQAPAAIRVPLVSTTTNSHSIVTTVLSATSTANPVTILYTAVPPAKPYVGGGPTVFEGGQLYYTTTPSIGQAFNTMYQTVADQFFADGVAINHVDLAKYVNPATDFQASHISYPNSLGQQHIADALAGKAQYQKVPTSGFINPKSYGATCDTQFFDTNVFLTATTSTVTITGYNWSSKDVGKIFAGSAGESLGIPGGISTIAAVAPDGSAGYLAADPTVTATAEAAMGHDDTVGLNNSSAASALSGTPVLLPNGCGVRNFTPTSGSTLTGNTKSLGYNYVNINPILYGLLTGYTDDPDEYIINLGNNNNYGIALDGFQISSPSFPYLGFPGITAACVGTPTGTASVNQGVSISNMTFENCPIGFGLRYGGTVSGNEHIFFQSQHNQFGNNGWGMYGSFSDYVDHDSVFTGNFTGGIELGQFGSSYASTPGRFVQTRVEEGGIGMLCDGCIGNHLEGVEFQFDGGPAIILNGGWQGFSMTGGFLDDDATHFYCGSFQATISGTTMTVSSANCGTNAFGIVPGSIISGPGVAADTYVVGTDYTGVVTGGDGVGTYTITPSQSISSSTSMSSAASTEILVNGAGSNNAFASWDNVQGGGGIPYDILGNSASSYNIQFKGGTFSDTGNSKSYTAAFSRWLPASSPPKTFAVDTIGLPFLRTGRTDLSFSTSGQMGIGTAVATPGTALDLLSNTTTYNSSLGIPNGTTQNRPASPVPGMVRFNSSTSFPEAYYSNSWNTINLLPGFIGGLSILNDTTTPNSVIDVLPGTAMSDDNSVLMSLVYPWSKTTGSFSQGWGSGCLDTGSVTTSTFYSVYEISGTAGTDILCSASATSPTLPSGFGKKKRLSCGFKTDGSSHILPITQDGNGSYTTCWWGSPTLDVNAAFAATTTNALETLNVPTGIKVQPIYSYSISGTAGAVLAYSPDTAPAATTTNLPFTASPGFSYLASGTTGGPANAVGPLVTTNTNAQIGLDLALSTTTTVGIITQGWREIQQPSIYGTPTFDGYASFSSNSSLSNTATVETINLTTQSGNDSVYVFSMVASGTTVSSISDTTSLSWTLRKGYNNTQNLDLEEWYAVSPLPLTNDTISITYSKLPGYNQIYGLGVAGTNTSALYDTSTHVPATATVYETTNVTGTISTNQAHDLLFSFYGATSGNLPGGTYVIPTLPANFVSIFPTSYLPGITFGPGITVNLAYQNVGNTLSSQGITYQGSSTNNTWQSLVVDAVRASGN